MQRIKNWFLSQMSDTRPSNNTPPIQSNIINNDYSYNYNNSVHNDHSLDISNNNDVKIDLSTNSCAFDVKQDSDIQNDERYSIFNDHTHDQQTTWINDVENKDVWDDTIHTRHRNKVESLPTELILDQLGPKVEWGHEIKMPARVRGQLKLFLFDQYFIAKYCHTIQTIVYVGAAQGHHIVTLAKLNPKHHFHLYDSETFVSDLYNMSNVTIHQQLFNLNDARSYLGQRIALIMDIRFAMGNMKPETYENLIILQNYLQFLWAKESKAVFSSIKFRQPFKAQIGHCKMPKVKILKQAYTPRGSTEVRFIYDGNDNYLDFSFLAHEQLMAYHNCYTRQQTHRYRGRLLIDFDAFAEAAYIDVWVTTWRNKLLTDAQFWGFHNKIKSETLNDACYTIKYCDAKPEKLEQFILPDEHLCYNFDVLHKQFRSSMNHIQMSKMEQNVLLNYIRKVNGIVDNAITVSILFDDNELKTYTMQKPIKLEHIKTRIGNNFELFTRNENAHLLVASDDVLPFIEHNDLKLVAIQNPEMVDNIFVINGSLVKLSKFYSPKTFSYRFVQANNEKIILSGNVLIISYMYQHRIKDLMLEQMTLGAMLNYDLVINAHDTPFLVIKQVLETLNQLFKSITVSNLNDNNVYRLITAHLLSLSNDVQSLLLTGGILTLLNNYETTGAQHFKERALEYFYYRLTCINPSLSTNYAKQVLINLTEIDLMRYWNLEARGKQGVALLYNDRLLQPPIIKVNAVIPFKQILSDSVDNNGSGMRVKSTIMVLAQLRNLKIMMPHFSSPGVCYSLSIIPDPASWCMEYHNTSTLEMGGKLSNDMYHVYHFNLTNTLNLYCNTANFSGDQLTSIMATILTKNGFTWKQYWHGLEPTLAQLENAICSYRLGGERKALFTNSKANALNTLQDYEQHLALKIDDMKAQALILTQDDTTFNELSNINTNSNVLHTFQFISTLLHPGVKTQRLITTIRESMQRNFIVQVDNFVETIQFNQAFNNECTNQHYLKLFITKNKDWRPLTYQSFNQFMSLTNQYFNDVQSLYDFLYTRTNWQFVNQQWSLIQRVTIPAQHSLDVVPLNGFVDLSTKPKYRLKRNDVLPVQLPPIMPDNINVIDKKIIVAQIQPHKHDTGKINIHDQKHSNIELEKQIVDNINKDNAHLDVDAGHDHKMDNYYEDDNQFEDKPTFFLSQLYSDPKQRFQFKLTLETTTKILFSDKQLDTIFDGSKNDLECYQLLHNEYTSRPKKNKGFYKLNQRANLRAQHVFQLFEYINDTLKIDVPYGDNLWYLDYGCGNGEITKAVMQAIEIDPKRVLGIDDGLFHGSKPQQNLPFHIETNFDFIKTMDDDSYNFVTLFQVLHHCENMDQTLIELNRIMKINSILIIRDHNVNSIEQMQLVDFEHHIYTQVIDEQPDIDFYNTHWALYLPVNKMEELIESYGFKLLECQTFCDQLTQNTKGFIYYRVFILDHKYINAAPDLFEQDYDDHNEQDQDQGANINDDVSDTTH